MKFEFFQKKPATTKSTSPRQELLKDRTLSGDSSQVQETSHLKEGFRPIMACVGTNEDFVQTEDIDDYRRFLLAKGGNHEIHNVDYYEQPEILQRKNYKNEGYYSYVISVIDSLDKFSSNFFDCTGIVVTGRDKKTGEDISFMSHQDPGAFLIRHKTVFTNNLQQSLEELKRRCVEGSIDAVIVGGNYNPKDKSEDFSTNYIESIKMISLIVHRALGFQPVILNGPKSSDSSIADIVFYDNSHRRLYFMRPEVNNAVPDFESQDLETQQKNWEEKSSL